MEISCLTDGPVNDKMIAQFIKEMGEKTNSGGHSIFIGQVRADKINGKKVKAIEYSAYETMVNVEVSKIKETILSEFNDAKTIEIVHSVGIVKVGKISLFIIVSAGHRHDAIEACSKAVELVKKRLPVWKKEIFEDNSHEWKENRPD